MKLSELKASRADKIAAMNAIVDALTEQNPIMTDEQEGRFVELESEVRALSKTISAVERAQTLRNDLALPTNVAPRPDPANAPEQQPDPSAGFENLGEFVLVCSENSWRNPADNRLLKIKNEQSMGTGAKGGFAVPKQWGETLLMVDPQEAVIEPRATVVPAGDPPDAEISWPSLDQTSTSNMHGGVTVSWIGEGGAKPETDTDLVEVTLKPEELAGHIVASDKLLRNWAAASAFVSNQLRLAMIAEKDIRFLRGDGIAKPRGLIGSAAQVLATRAGANLIDFADIVGMLSSFFMRGQEGVWIASQSTLPQLLTLEDTAGNLIYQSSARDGLPNTLMGRPVILNERSPALGAQGDLVLADLSAYLIKMGSGPFVASSEHVNFLNNKTVIKAFLFVDGKPWLTAPVVGEDSSNRSPFVVLDA